MIIAKGGGRSSKVGGQEGRGSGAVPLVGSGAKPSVRVWGEAPQKLTSLVKT